MILCSSGLLQAQETITLNLKQAVNKSWENSNKAKISKEKIHEAGQKLNILKNERYPDFDIGGQYLYLTDPNLDLKFNRSDENSGEEQNSEAPTPHHLMIGQANLTLPVFSGFKIKNVIKSAENHYKAAQYYGKSNRAELAMETIKTYVALYKARKTIELVKDNLRSIKRRVRDFSDLEKNGLLARNDLLKAELQQSKVELSLA